MFEHFTRVIGGGRNTFLFGNGVFRAVNEILRGAFDANDGKEAERNGQDLIIIFANSAVQTMANDFGKVLRMDMTTGTKLTGVKNTGIQHDGIHDLKNGGGKIGAGTFRVMTAAEITGGKLALENIHVAFAAVKDHLFFNHGNAVRFLRSAGTGAKLSRDPDIHGDGDLIKAAVKGNVIHVNICAKNFCALRADGRGAFQKLGSHIGKIYGNVFKAIFIAAAVKDPIGINVYRIPSAAIRRIISDVRHKDLSSFHKQHSKQREFRKSSCYSICRADENVKTFSGKLFPKSFAKSFLKKFL
jgi:hypothetical protein